jgi:hypothetical protein
MTYEVLEVFLVAYKGISKFKPGVTCWAKLLSIDLVRASASEHHKLP